MMAANRLCDIYSRLDLMDMRASAHKRRLELRALQVTNPTLPLPDSEPEESSRDEKVDEAFAFLKKPKGGEDVATV